MKNLIEKLNNNKYFIPLILLGFVSLLFVAEFVDILVVPIMIILLGIFTCICIFCGFEKSIGIILFLLAFKKISIEFINIWWGNLLFGIFIIVFSIKYLIELIQKKCNAYWVILVLTFIIVLFGFINFNKENFVNIIYDAAFLVVLYLAFVNRLKANKYNLVKYFIGGLSFSIIVGMILYFIPSTQSFVCSSGNEMRFSALMGQPNALQMLCVLTLAIIEVIFYKKKISILTFVFLYSIISMVGFFTKSKAFIVCFLILSVVLIIMLVARYKKKGLYVSLLLVVIGILFCILYREKVVEIVDRFVRYNYDNVMDNLLTGRWSIWKQYFDVWSKSLYSILFGCGVTAYEMSYIGAHSAYVNCLYRYGLLGSLLILSLAITYFYYVRDKKVRFNFINCIPVLMFMLLALEETIFSIFYSWLFVLVCIFIFNTKKDEEKHKKRLLIYNGTLLKGGTETYIISIVKNLDFSVYKIDVLIKNGVKINNNILEELHALGCNIYYNDKITNVSQLWWLFKFFIKFRNCYDIIHINSTSRATGIIAFFAKFICKINKVIFHSHMGGTDSKTFFADKVGKVCLKFSSDELVACSMVAGKYMFGEKYMQKHKVTILNNFIDINKYDFNIEKRKEIRKLLGIQDNTFVIMHVGRFVEQKNHKYLIDVFNKFVSRNKNSLLLLIGDGKLKSSVQQQVNNYTLNDKVRFLGIINNVNDYLQGADCFIMTSLHEGLPFVAVEAQASGLPCVLSSNISREADLTSNNSFIDINEDDIELWCEELTRLKTFKRTSQKEIMASKGFTVETAMGNLIDLYEKL